MPSPYKHQTSSDYFHVRMGRLNHLNAGSSYAFPNEEAAFRFARAHKDIARGEGVERDIVVVYPDGQEEEI